MIIVLTQKWNNRFRLVLTSLPFLKDNDRINKGQVWTLSDYCCDYCPKFQFLSAEVQQSRLETSQSLQSNHVATDKNQCNQSTQRCFSYHCCENLISNCSKLDTLSLASQAMSHAKSSWKMPLYWDKITGDIMHDVILIVNRF